MKGVSVEDLLEEKGLNPGRLSPAAHDIWSMWLDLNAFRPHTGFGPGPLQVSDIVAYFNMAGIPQRYQPRLLRLLAVLDRTYFEYVGRKAEKSKRLK